MQEQYPWLLALTLTGEDLVSAATATLQFAVAGRAHESVSLFLLKHFDFYSVKETDDGNTLLSDEHVEMLRVLRMNRKFMEFMREHYGHLIKDQHFGKTIIDTDDVDGEDVEMADAVGA